MNRHENAKLNLQYISMQMPYWMGYFSAGYLYVCFFVVSTVQQWTDWLGVADCQFSCDAFCSHLSLPLLIGCSG